MEAVDPVRSAQENLLLSVHQNAKRLAGKGEIQYTHILVAFAGMCRADWKKDYNGAFEGGVPLSNDLERAEALATLVENVAGNTHYGKEVQEVAHALRRWTSLGKNTKDKIDRVFQDKILLGRKARWSDRVAEFFNDLRTIMSRLSSKKDKAFAQEVSQKVEQTLSEGEEGINVPFKDLKFPPAKNSAQTAFLKSAEELYEQFLKATEGDRQGAIEQYESLIIQRINKSGMPETIEQMKNDEIEREIEYLNELLSKEDTPKSVVSAINATLQKLEQAKMMRSLQS